MRQFMRTKMAKLAAIQLCSTTNVEENLNTIDRLLSTLDNQESHLVVLPECCLLFGVDAQAQLALAKNAQQSLFIMNSLARLAIKYHVVLVAGTIPVVSNCGGKYTNTSYVFSVTGEMIADYHKIHLFDVSVNDNTGSYSESSLTEKGTKTTTITTTIANLGLSVCYDLRFPELFRALRTAGAEVISVASAFTKVTGQVHWQALLQARAIENQCYVIAAGQQGRHNNGRETWGHSMIISPWGEILTILSEGEGIITTEFKPDEVVRIRQAMPIQTHNQYTVELKN